MIALVAAAVSLFYALQLPLCIVAVMEYADGARIGVGVSTLSQRIAGSRALKHMHPTGRKISLPSLEKTGWIDGALRGAKYLYAHRLLLHITVSGEIGGTDAARTALYWGAAQGLLQTLSAATDGRITGTLRPNFAAARSNGIIRVTYAVKTGTALRATLQAMGDYLSERVRKWINIPLKA